MLVIRKQYLHLVHNVKTDTIVTGWGGKIPNKGAVAISFDFGNISVNQHKSMLFINAHLDAHIEHRSSRMEQFVQIKRRFIDLEDEESSGPGMGCFSSRSTNTITPYNSSM